MSEGPFCVEPVVCLAQGHNTVASVRLEHETPRSLGKHSTTELPIDNLKN